MTYSLIDRLQDCGTDLAEEAIAEITAKDALIRELVGAITSADVWSLHVGYDSGAGGGNFIYEEAILLKDLAAALTRAKEAGYE